MCRWIAYSGPSIPLADLLTRPDHSLIVQSQHATENVVTVNGDGFGVGWYGHGHLPGTFRDTHPAWNNSNLQHLARHIQSPLFLAHVRATSGTAVQETNCHPFLFGKWLFQHNGSVPSFRQLKRRMLFDVAPEFFPHIFGSTDSEILFHLALTFELQKNPQEALERLVGYVEHLRRIEGVFEPLTFSAAVTDGQRLFAVRYSSDGNSPTLYHSNHVHALKVVNGSYEALSEGAIIVLSEPLDELHQHWTEVPESSFITVEQGVTTIVSFVPRTP